MKKAINGGIEDLWTDIDLAEYLGVSPQTIANRVSAGLEMPPFMKICGKRRWLARSVIEYLRDREQRCGPA